MGVRMMDLLSGNLDTLRYEPTAKRVRVCVGGEPVADTCEARLVWEPRRVVPTYAVPITALTAQLVPAGAESGADEDVGVRLPAISSRPILDPTVPFDAHSCAGTAFDVIAGEETGAAAAFRPDDPDLADYVILEFDAFEWREEDEPVVSHPHDPFSRIDVLRSSRHVRIELDGRLLAESPTADAAVRDAASGPVLSASRGRGRPARTQRHGELLRLQGPGVVLLAARRTARRGVDVSRTAARRRTRA